MPAGIRERLSGLPGVRYFFKRQTGQVGEEGIAGTFYLDAVQAAFKADEHRLPEQSGRLKFHTIPGDVPVLQEE